jgi:hypothetical protein
MDGEEGSDGAKRNATPENRGARARVCIGFRFALDFLRNEILTVLV